MSKLGKWLLKKLAGFEAKSVFQEVKSELHKNVEAVEKRVELAVTKALTKIVASLIILAGIIFLLVGASSWLGAVLNLKPGVNHLITGLALLILGWLVKSKS